MKVVDERDHLIDFLVHEIYEERERKTVEKVLTSAGDEITINTLNIEEEIFNKLIGLLGLLNFMGVLKMQIVVQLSPSRKVLKHLTVQKWKMFDALS